MLWLLEPTESYKLRETNIAENTDLQRFGKSEELTIWRASSMPSGHHSSLHISERKNKSGFEDFTEPFVCGECFHCVLTVIIAKMHFKSNSSPFSHLWWERSLEGISALKMTVGGIRRAMWYHEARQWQSWVLESWHLRTYSRVLCTTTPFKKVILWE